MFSDNNRKVEGFLTERLQRPWHDVGGVDAKIKELFRLAATEGGVYLLQGPELCGKTRTLCHLYEQVPLTAFKLIRFIGLTYSSSFAHEVWRQINLQLCALTGRDPHNIISVSDRSYHEYSDANVDDGY
ncbi:unnamed protein product [Nippostrongylus brasiliensis]|uniref:AAA_14 domain-containing protein n=1 Tax=Nippostrongylus brasiliensis TaxID=27835 RepID=A0A0N4XQH3_NIPBR|nr:unnamed protein product [Nippostrongylus brasiliensis]